jgi:hypothetical protein
MEVGGAGKDVDLVGKIERRVPAMENSGAKKEVIADCPSVRGQINLLETPMKETRKDIFLASLVEHGRKIRNGHRERPQAEAISLTRLMGQHHGHLVEI